MPMQSKSSGAVPVQSKSVGAVPMQSKSAGAVPVQSKSAGAARPPAQPAKQPPPQPAQPPASPPASPPADEGAENPNLQRRDSWKEFSDVDPLYALQGEFGTHPVYNEAKNAIDEDRCRGYVERLFVPDVIKKTKEWVEVWATMNIPVDKQDPVLRIILEVGLESEASETMPDVLSDLLKGHRVKTKMIEEAMTSLFEMGEDHNGCLSRFFFLIFPKSPTSEWGWSRVGWNWAQWWNMYNRILNVMDQAAAFECLRTLLEMIEQESGTYLPHQQIWDEKRLDMVRKALCKYGGFAEDELSCALSVVLE